MKIYETDRFVLVKRTYDGGFSTIEIHQIWSTYNYNGSEYITGLYSADGEFKGEYTIYASDILGYVGESNELIEEALVQTTNAFKALSRLTEENLKQNL